MGKSKAIEPRAAYKVTTYSPDRLAMLLSEAAGSQGINPVVDLRQVRIPAGGGINWTVPTLGGEENVKDITGIIVHHHTARSYWATSIEQSGGNTPPDCVSYGGETGYGTPGGSCASCPMAQFGSDVKGRGQACKQMQWLYLLQSSSLMPLLLSVPPTGIRNARQYLIGLAGEGYAPYEVITTIGLERTKNQDSIQYSQPVFRLVDKVDQPEILEAYSTGLRQHLNMRQMPLLDESDFEGLGEEVNP